MKNKTTEINKNVYYVGDLCYVMRDEWGEMVVLQDFDNETRSYQLSDGREYFMFSTMYGDGQYNDLDGNPYSVDSGTIGAVLVNNITDTEALNQALSNGLGHLYQFETELNENNCSYDEGTIYIGRITIDTNGYDDSEELDILSDEEILAIVA